MLKWRLLWIAAILCSCSPTAQAIEGPAAAGPIGGTDLQSGFLPPPGVYFGTSQLFARTIDFLDRNGNTSAALKDAQLSKVVGGPFAFFVPDAKIFGGSIALAAVVPAFSQWGSLFPGESRQHDTGVGDPYVEIAWSRYFGTPRPSICAGAKPIPEGLSVLLGFGVVFPAGKYDAATPLGRALSPGTNIWDFAPTAAFTFTTTPILAEGTEFSAKFYWNNYLTNPDTKYRTGDLLNLDFAVSERIGRFQVGVTGFYAWQVENDRIRNVSIPPDGARARVLYVGPIVAYDMPESQSALKLKAIVSPFAENTVTSWAVALAWIKKY